MNKFLRLLLAFTWELPQSIIALVCIPVLRAKSFDSEFRFCFTFKSNRIASFSLGEFIFFNEQATESLIWDIIQKHEYGHSIQSRIFGFLYLLLIALPSVIWNLLSSKSESCHKIYYKMPWESGADKLGGVQRD